MCGYVHSIVPPRLREPVLPVHIYALKYVLHISICMRAVRVIPALIAKGRTHALCCEGIIASWDWDWDWDE